MQRGVIASHERSGTRGLLCARGATTWHIPELRLVQHTLRLLAILDQTGHVALHLLDLAKKTIEIIVDCGQEISQRALNLLHLELDADDAFMELLTDIGSA